MGERGYTVCVRRRDGKGTEASTPVDLMAWALNRAERYFAEDKTITMAWVLNGSGHMVGEPLLREST